MDRFIKNLAKGAGAILRDGYNPLGTRTTVKTAKWDVVTKYDKLSEKYLVNKIRTKYPNHGILSEESGSIKKANRFWILDPLDGTRDFARGIPSFAVTIGFIENNECIYGGIYVVMNDEFFFASKGHGAKLNNTRIRVNQNKEIEFAVGTTDVVPSYLSQDARKKLNGFIFANQIFDYTRLGGPVCLAYVAAGRLDFAISCGAYPWDLAAGSLIAVESGAKISDLEGGEYRWNKREIIAANPVLYSKIIKNLE